MGPGNGFRLCVVILTYVFVTLSKSNPPSSRDFMSHSSQVSLHRTILLWLEDEVSPESPISWFRAGGIIVE